MPAQLGTSRQQGFTLVELLIVVTMLGGVLAVVSGSMDKVLSLQHIAERDRNQFYNMQIGRAMVDYAANSITAPGELPAEGSSPYAVPTSDTELLDAYYGHGLSESLATTDGTKQANARVYRSVEKTVDAPILGGTGPEVTLTYQDAALFMLADADAVLGGPGAAVEGGDLADAIGASVPAYRLSSLSMQKAMLRTTAHRLQRIRQSISDFAAMEKITAPATELETRNYLPGEGAASVGTGDGCNEGWIDLSVSEDVLPVVGLTKEEYGVTAWGQPIQYCRNFGPGDPSVPPFYGAIRLQKNVPDGSGDWVNLTL